MEIISTEQKGKSASNSVIIAYTVRKDGENDFKEIHGTPSIDGKNIGFLSYDCLQKGFQFSLIAGNGLDWSEKKDLFDRFVDDVDDLMNPEE